jgi:hypothetical protein
VADATYAVPSFLGGELSQFAQGRFDKPDYRISLNVCLNAFPVEIGPWTRRPGTQHASPTRGGLAGRVIKFDFEQADPVTLEFTAGFLRARNGAVLIATNDSQSIFAIDTNNPANVATLLPHGWSAGQSVVFSNLGANDPLLQNRVFTIVTVPGSSTIAIADSITGAPIDGSTLGPFVSGTVSRVQELATSYIGSLWSNIRAVQAETTSILLSPTIAPQALTVPTLPSTGVNPVFALGAAIFKDGPYLDPFTNGVQANPNQTTGIVTITLSFPAYVATTSYGKGEFVSSSSVNYESQVDQNIGNTPATSPLAWQAVSAGAAINPPPGQPSGTGRGFLGTDIGRLVRFFSEPQLWSATTAYGSPTVVSYNPTGAPGSATYWQAQTTQTGAVPGSDLTNWALVAPGAALPSIAGLTESPAAAAGPAQWTWGNIVSLANLISGALAGSLNVGSLVGNGGLGAAFDGTPSKPNGSCSSLTVVVGLVTAPQILVFESYVGKNYSASPQKISSVTVYPSTDAGFFKLVGYTATSGLAVVAINLWGSNTAPTGPETGTRLGTSGQQPTPVSPITVVSTDQVTSWNYVWVEVDGAVTAFGPDIAGALFISQVEFFSPTGTGTSAVAVNVELLGPALLYTTAITTWQMGAFSNTTGWPTCGCYASGRLWLAGAIGNRFDACYANGINGGTINFAPTDQYGVVTAAHAISETLNSDSVNPIYWMEGDEQGVIVGTQGPGWLIFAPGQGAIGPNNIDSRPIGHHGYANVEPRRTEHTLVAVQRFGRKLLELFPDVFSGKFTAPNIADKAQHIVRNFLAELAYTSAAAPIIWGRDLIGNLFGLTYKRDTLSTSQGPSFNAWHRHALGSGRSVQSICVGPSTDGNLDTLTMVTLDQVTNIYHVELLTDTGDEQTPLAQAWFLDDAVNPSSTSTSNAAVAGAPYGGLTINGLWHLNGKIVQVFAGGLDCGDRGPGTTGFTDFTVANGSVFVPYGDGIGAGSGRGLFTAAFAAALPLTEIVVGFTFTSQGQLVRPIMPAETGARNGPALAKVHRTHRSGALLSSTLGISFGTNFTVSGQLTARFTLADQQTNIAPLTTFSGVFAAEIFDQYSYDSMICWQITRPWPATVVAIAGNLQTQDQ